MDNVSTPSMRARNGHEERRPRSFMTSVGAITGRRGGAGSGWLRRRDPVSRVVLVVAVSCPAGRGPAY